MKRIRQLGLRISPRKAEAMWFYGGTCSKPPQEENQLEDAWIEVKEQLKYLGLTLGSGWRFDSASRR